MAAFFIVVPIDTNCIHPEDAGDSLVLALQQGSAEIDGQQERGFIPSGLDTLSAISPAIIGSLIRGCSLMLIITGKAMSVGLDLGFRTTRQISSGCCNGRYADFVNKGRSVTDGENRDLEWSFS